MRPLFLTLEDMVAAGAEMVRPPERLTVSEAAERYRKLNNPGSYVGPWRNSVTPYLVEPMDVLTSLDFTGSIFVGPARTGKTDMVFNWLTHTAICDPADMMVIHITQNTARDWSQIDLARCFRNTKDLGQRLIPGRQNDNVHDKFFRSGMTLRIKWPTISELSGKTIPRLWITDYDRMDQDIDGEGAPFDLARKRAQTYRRFGMTVAESSPGYEIETPTWTPTSAHEAAPTKGILALYNRGDRRRWYWRCPQCHGAFEPDFSLLNYPKSNDAMEAAEQVVLVCPHDGYPIPPSMKREMNAAGRWVRDGMTWNEDGSITGEPRRTDIASFWMKGPAAAFQDWSSLVLKYLQASEEFEKTGSEEALKTTINTDQGLPYLPKALATDRLPEALKQRAMDWGGDPETPLVPHGVRFLISTVDVQKSSFVVQVHGFAAGGDIYLIDMFKIRRSERIDGNGEREILDPAGYGEDWLTLVDQVLLKTYALADGSGRHMRVKAVGCDSGGRAGVTSNAYNFWRWLRDQGAKLHPGANLHTRFQLVKGETKKGAPRARLDYPDTQKKDRFNASRGDVPVLFLQSNLLKDQISAMLGRDQSGGAVFYPSWTPDYIYAQLTQEVRTAQGWDNPSNRRNEAWDLLYYAVGVALNAKQIAPVAEKIDWSKPPTWAEEWDRNDLVFDPILNSKVDNQPRSGIRLSDLASRLA